MIRLALIRHGHTAWNRAGRIQGRTDVPLDDDARAHLRGLCLPAGWQTADIVASPLRRATETAELIANRPPQQEQALIEMDWGTWEGSQGLALLAEPSSGYRHIEDWGWDYCPPGGEPPRVVRDRVMRWLDGLSRDTVAVCHIGVMRVILAIATGWDFDGPAPFRIKRDRLYIIERNAQTLHLRPEPERLERRRT